VVHGAENKHIKSAYVVKKIAKNVSFVIGTFFQSLMKKTGTAGSFWIMLIILEALML